MEKERVSKAFFLHTKVRVAIMKKRDIGHLTFLLIAFCFIFIGCASTKLIGKLPSIEEAGNVAKIIVIRSHNFVGGAVSYKVTFDGKDFLLIKTGEYTSFNVPAGKHTIGVKYTSSAACIIPLIALTPLHMEKDIDCKPGNQYYFLVSPSVEGVEIEQLHKTEALKYISCSTFRTLERNGVDP